MTLADRLKGLMIARYGSTNKSRLGKELGVSESTVRNWLKGFIPRPPIMKAICQLFIVSPAWFQYGIEEEKNKIILQEKEKTLLEYAQKAGFDRSLEILKLITAEASKSVEAQSSDQHHPVQTQTSKRRKKSA